MIATQKMEKSLNHRNSSDLEFKHLIQQNTEVESFITTNREDSPEIYNDKKMMSIMNEDAFDNRESACKESFASITSYQSLLGVQTTVPLMDVNSEGFFGKTISIGENEVQTSMDYYSDWEKLISEIDAADNNEIPLSTINNIPNEAEEIRDPVIISKIECLSPSIETIKSDPELKEVEIVYDEEIIDDENSRFSKTSTENFIASQTSRKKYFCIFCKKLMAKFPVHLESVHKDEEQVKELAALPKGCPKRKEIIANIRNMGSFEFNSNQNYNKGKIIVCRRPQRGKIRSISHYVCCPNCKGFYSKFALRRHYKKCVSNVVKGERCTFTLVKRLYSQIHHKASPTLRNEVLPVLRDDKVSAIIKLDELCILFGNRLVQKFRDPHHHQMIRAKLRIIGRFFVEMRKLDPQLKSLSQVFIPKNLTNVVSAINAVAQYDYVTKSYKSLTLVADLCSSLKKLVNIYINECVKREDVNKKDVEDFLNLFQKRFCVMINRYISNNQFENKPKKDTSLPSIDDITRLRDFLETNRRCYRCQLEEQYSFEAWKQLARFTLISIVVFCNKRAGEVERLRLTDLQFTDDKQYTNQMMPTTKRELAKIFLRGETLRRIDKDILKCIQLIVEYREMAGVKNNNPYVFGIPCSFLQYKHLIACNLLKEYSIACGATRPASLRGNQLLRYIEMSI